MSKRDWGNGIAVGLIAGGGLAIVLMVWIIGLNYCPGEPCNYHRSPNTNPGQYEYNVPFAYGPNTSPGVEPEDTKGDPHYYDRKDLRAQESVARATNAIVLISLASVCLGVLGTGLLIWNLFEVRKALTADDAALDEARKQTSFAEKAVAEARRQADLAEEAYRKSERPYLFFRYVDNLGLSQIQGSAPHIEYKLANYGKTPAIFDSIYIELVPASKLKYENRIPTFAPETRPREWYEVILAGRDANNGDRVYLTGIPDIATQKWNPANETIALHAHIFYRDPSSATRYEHHFALLSYNGKPFRLDFSHHQSTDEG